MTKIDPAALSSIVRRFRVYGEFVAGAPYGSGHIHDTFETVFDQAGTRVRYILQHINDRVFTDPPTLMENIARVNEHLKGKLEQSGAEDRSRRALRLVPTVDGALFTRDDEKRYWRMYLFIEGAQTYDRVTTPELAYAAAMAFGRFQMLLADLPGPPLRETIPGFHDTPRRVAALWREAALNASNRVGGCPAEFEFVRRRESWVDRLEGARRTGKLPMRITHNDTKLNNVMIDDATGEGICVIDLDTVMPGLSAHDFGDLVRTAAHEAPEDTLDLDRVELRMPVFEALVGGYRRGTADFLTTLEVESLVVGAKTIALEIGGRFLTDHLAGDTYFKIHRPGQNLDRCRTQFRLVESIEKHEETMRNIVRKVWKV